MRSLEITLDEETARSLALEAEVLGFDDVAAYVTWLIDRRADIDCETDRCRRLAAFTERVSDADAEADVAALAEAVAAAEEPTMDGDDPDVARLEDEDLIAAADALSTVEGKRLDEFASRAVAQTRERLGEGLGSGIDYDSRTTLSEDRRPGEDIADLDAIEVPGWDEELQERRRRAVGAALAYLRDVEEAKRGDFVTELFEDYPAGYDSPDAWWECLKRGLRQVDRVIPAREGSRIWSYRTTPGRVTRISYS